MAKQRSDKRNLTRRQLARHKKDQQLQRTLTIIAIAVVALVVLIIGYGIVTELFIKANRPVAIVGDAEISTREFQARQRYERLMTRFELAQYQDTLNQLDPNDETLADFTQQVQQRVSNLEQQLSPELATLFGGQVLDSMIEETIVRQEAAERDITVTQDEVDIQVELMMGYDREAAASAETVTSTTQIMTAEEYKTTYGNFQSNVLKESNFSESAYREMMEANLLKTRIQQALEQEIESVVDQVQVIYFAVDTEEAASSLSNRINVNEEDPLTLVEELNNDEVDETIAFELPWLPTGYLSTQWGPEIENLAFSTPIGTASQPVEGSDGEYVVIYVSGHEERALEANFLAQASQEKYEEWLTEQKDALVEYKEWQESVVTEP